MKNWEPLVLGPAFCDGVCVYVSDWGGGEAKNVSRVGGVWG